MTFSRKKKLDEYDQDNHNQILKRKEHPKYNEDGRGRYKVTYENPKSNNIGNDRFETKAEASKYANDLRRRGYKNITIGETIQHDRYLRTHGKKAGEINELSSKTLGSYINKAGEDRHNKGFKAGQAYANKDYKEFSNKTADSIAKRGRGIERAVKKLTRKVNESAFLGPDFGNSPSLKNPEFLQKVRNELNQLSGSYITPYIALHRVRKQLAQYNIFMTEELVRLPEDYGEYYFQVYQFGTEKMYKTHVGDTLDQDDIDPEIYLYLNISKDSNFGGFYNIDIQLYNMEELTSIIGDDEIEEF